MKLLTRCLEKAGASEMKCFRCMLERKPVTFSCPFPESPRTTCGGSQRAAEIGIASLNAGTRQFHRLVFSDNLHTFSFPCYYLL